MSFSKKNQAIVVPNSEIGSPETKLLEASESPKNLGSEQRAKDPISPMMDESPKNLISEQKLKNQNSSPIMDESPKKMVWEQQPKDYDDYEKKFENGFQNFREILKVNDCHFSTYQSLMSEFLAKGVPEIHKNIFKSSEEDEQNWIKDLTQGSLPKFQPDYVVDLAPDQPRAIICAVITPDSTKLITGSGDKKVNIWDINKSECIATLRGHVHAINGLAIAKKKPEILYSCGLDGILIWDTEKLILIGFLENFPEKSYISPIFSTDGSLLFSTTTEDGDTYLAKVIKVWCATSNKLIETITNDNNEGFGALLATPNYLIAGSREKLIFYHQKNFEKVNTIITEHEEEIISIAINHDNSKLATLCSNGIVILWGLRQTEIEIIKKFPEQTFNISGSVIFAQDSQKIIVDICTSFEKAKIKIFDVVDFEKKNEFEGNCPVAYDSDKLIYCLNSEIKVLDLQVKGSTKAIPRGFVKKQEFESLKNILFLEENLENIFVFSALNVLYVWDYVNDHKIDIFKHSEEIETLALLKESKIIIIDSKKKLTIITIMKFEEITSPELKDFHYEGALCSSEFEKEFYFADNENKVVSFN